MSMSPIFLGYRAKQPWTPDPKWWPAEASNVEHVCSVSDCLCEPPPGFVERWDFNRAYCYPTEALALATVPEGRVRDYPLFAYWFMPVARDAAGREYPLSPHDHFVSDGEPLSPDPGELRDYEVLGYDIVSTQGTASYGFECSPLSCNGMAERVNVNRFCLVDRLDVALEAARTWNAEELPPEELVEPGNYIVVKVAMKARLDVSATQD